MDKDSTLSVINLSDLIDKDKQGIVCVTIARIGEPRVGVVSKWKYRELSIKDGSKESVLQIGDDRFLALKLKINELVLFHVRSRGLDGEGNLTILFQREASSTEAATIVSTLLQDISSLRMAKRKIKEGPTVWPFHSREARSLLRLVKNYLKDKQPQHYHKFSVDQFVAQDLYGAGWIKRMGKGRYIPTDEVLFKIRQNETFPSGRIREIKESGVSFQDSPNATYKTIQEYLNSETDAETALEEFKETMQAIHQD